MPPAYKPGDDTHTPAYDYTPEERQFVSQWWVDFEEMWRMKQEPLDILGGRSITKFQDDSVRDYAVLTGEIEDPNDPIKEYVSSISRDKANIFIANMTSQLLYPSVKAFNNNREIDKVLTKICRPMLEWCNLHDGYPTEDGHIKFVRSVHKMVVEGTTHIQDDFNKEDGLVSSSVPNEEVFIPNFWQPNIQAQPKLVRAQLNVTYAEAEAIYGELKNFEYVSKFGDSWLFERPELKQKFQGILNNDEVQIMHVWRALTRAELKKEKDKGRVPARAKRAKYYNVLINDIPMFPVDNLSPYKDGLYPISKGIFEHMAKPEFYWGNSLPNKIQHDKKWLDAWKTLLRYKGKLNALPPMVSLNGNFVDEEILLPGKITPINEELDLKKIDGVAEGVSQSEVTLLNDAVKEIDSGSVAPALSGQMPTKRMTKSEVLTADANAKTLLDSFSLQLAFLVQARSFPILFRAFQFLPRGVWKKVAIPDQKLSDGTRGNLEIIFQKIPKMTESEMMRNSIDMLKEEKMQAKKKNKTEKVYVDPSYARDAEYMLRSDAASALEDTDAMKRLEFSRNAQTYLSRPDLWNAKEVARLITIHNDDPDDILNEDTQPTMPAAEGNQLGQFAKTPAPYAPGLPQGVQLEDYAQA